ncbi:MAG: hypothetical protein VX498_05370 [Myxococcota bacterium]|nr:hypothetical protein [Myxococcota bacterium]
MRRGLSFPLLLMLALLTTASSGCNPWSSRCESLCVRLVDECGFNAWSSAEQCRLGCVDDMYRRTDAEELLGCYEAAVDPPSHEEAAELVNRALQAGFLAPPIDDQPLDVDAEIERAVAFGTCDVFSFVQCKVEAVQVPPSSPLLP